MVEGKDFKDPMIFDPALTAKGFVQVTRGKATHHVSDLRPYLSPPLRLETGLLTAPFLEQS